MAITTKSEAVRVPEQSVEVLRLPWSGRPLSEAHSAQLEFQLFCSPSDRALVFPRCHRGPGQIRRRQRLEWSPGFG